MEISITLALIIVTCLISWQAFNNPDMQYKLLHYPYIEARNKDYYRWLTACFVHGNWVHLAINMFVFHGFGEYVEGQFVELFGEVMGRLNFVLLYLLTGVCANVPTFLRHRDNQMFRSVGASGAVSGILFVFILFEPWARLGLFFVIPVRAILAAVLFLVYSSYASRKSNDMIDHEAHFYGAVFGLLFAIALKPSLLPDFFTELVEGWPY